MFHIVLGYKILKNIRAVVAHAFNPSTQKAEEGGSQFLRPNWSTELVPGQRNPFSGIHIFTFFGKM